MAINVSFNGATIYKPGAYSKTSIDLGGGFPLSPTGIIAIFGEADAGAPGASEINIANNVFSPDALPAIRSKYKSGNIVDACNFLFAPGADGAIPSGAQAVYIYKTNASVRASNVLASSYGTVRANEWGTGGNRISIKITGAGTTRTITLNQKRDLLIESATLGGNILLNVVNAAAGSTLTVDATKITLHQGVSLVDTIFLKADMNSIQDLNDSINILGDGWSSTLTSGQDPRLSVSVIDYGTGSVANLGGLNLLKDAYEVQQFFAASTIASLITPATSGLPVALSETMLAGGVKGASLTAEITNALSKFEKFRVNSVVPLFSRDATADISDNLTDVSSTYTIDGINQAVKTHLSLMSTTKKKSERQGYLSVKDTYANCKTKAMASAYSRVQMAFQDVRNIDAQGVIKWFQPWAGACLLAGARGGSPIGNPLTFKYFNMSGIRHTAQAMSTPEQNIVIDFDPDTQYDDAIQSGLTFWEAPQTGGFRLVVDNTTYGKDGNWVLNRGHVQYAADVLAFDFRSQLENIYVGLKNTVSAVEIKSTCESILSTYLAQGITVSTSDAKNGYKQLVVQMNGSTVNVSVVVKLVEGIDFVLADITLQRATQTA
jgi:hypothetical protein